MNGRLAELVTGCPRTERQRIVLEHDWCDAARPGAGLVADPAHGRQHALNSRFPMMLLWGEDRVMIYNDAYVPSSAGGTPRRWGVAARTSGPTSGRTSSP